MDDKKVNYVASPASRKKPMKIVCLLNIKKLKMKIK